MSDPMLIPERRDLVWFRGPDAIRFLNDLISQEIAVLDPGTVVRSFLLGPRGKLDHVLWVLRAEDGAGLVTDGGRGEELATTLGRYRIRVEVEISDPETGALVLDEGVVGPGAWAEDGAAIRAGLPWNGPPLTFLLGVEPAYPLMAGEEWERVRIEALEPRFGQDVDDATIPQETGLVSSSVDFDKGCFLGQELVARIDSRGHVNRHLRALRLTEAPAGTGAEIVAGDKTVGTLTSLAGNVGLALIRREVSPGDEVMIGDVPAVVL